MNISGYCCSRSPDGRRVSPDSQHVEVSAVLPASAVLADFVRNTSDRRAFSALHLLSTVPCNTLCSAVRQRPAEALWAGSTRACTFKYLLGYR